jgi:hypothetical protein
MQEQIAKALGSYRNVKWMLSSIPRELWYIFIPETIDDLRKLETNILSLKAREADRDVVMSVQRMSEFPLRPNVSLRETVVKARIQGLKKSRKMKKNLDRNNDKDW